MIFFLEILNQPVKKKRVVRLASSDSEMPELAPPKKRARIVQSTDSENMDSQTTVTCSQTADSQATVDYDIEDQQTNTQDDKTKIKFLTEAYPEKSKKVCFYSESAIYFVTTYLCLFSGYLKIIFIVCLI